jgi:ribosomal protein S18 acetylase RimI-like enzyme
MLDNNHITEPTAMPLFPGEELRLRSFRAGDRPEVMRLYREGLLGGCFDPADPAQDMQSIFAAYFRRPQDHFWVADIPGVGIIGTIAVFEDKTHIAHIRRLRVDPAWQPHTVIATQLLRTAIEHARSCGCLKIVFHTSLESAAALELLQSLGLQFVGLREGGGRHLLEFYDNLYATTSTVIRS